MNAENLVDVIRGNLIESKHLGHIAIVDYTGRLIASKGNVNSIVFARSSMKPLQAIPIIETGAYDSYQLIPADLSLCCASHNGEEQHTERVLSILEKANLVESSLQCGTHIPRWDEAYRKIIIENRKVTPVYNNCSGKHSGMLITAKHLNEPIDSYYSMEHPVQKRILQVISDLAEIPKEEIQIGVDGCGVPVHGIPLNKIALAYAKMAKPDNLPDTRKNSISQIVHAMMEAPEMVGGTNRFCTDFMSVVKGKMFGKAGAEGVYCIGDLRSGIGIAIKIEDGNSRAASPVAVEVMKQLSMLSEREIKELKEYHLPTLKNARNENVGSLQANFLLDYV
jgi:L-asparaginase II